MLSAQTIFNLLAGSGGLAGLGVAAKYLYDLIVLRKQRRANVESIVVDTDAKRVQMADTIIARFKETVQIQAEQIAALQEQCSLQDARIALQTRKIAILERTLILKGIEFPNDYPT